MKPYLLFTLIACLVLSACEKADIETIGDAETVKSIQDKTLSFNNRSEYLAEWQNYIDTNAPAILKACAETADRMWKNGAPLGFEKYAAALAPESIQNATVIGFPVFTVPKEIYDTAQRGTDVKSVAILDTMFIQYYILSKDVPVAEVFFRRENQQLKLYKGAEMTGSGSLALQQALKLNITCYGLRIPIGDPASSSIFRLFTLDNTKRVSPTLIPEFQELFETALAWRQY